MCALRCVIDYIRINDMCDFSCDLPSINWQNSPLLSGDKDKSGLTIDKARWIMELVGMIIITCTIYSVATNKIRLQWNMNLLSVNQKSVLVAPQQPLLNFGQI